MRNGFLLFAVLMASFSGWTQKKTTPKPLVTLVSLQKIYVGKWFVVDSVMGWYDVPEAPVNGRYNMGKYVTDVDDGQTLKLVALQENDLDRGKSFEPNALGETTSKRTGKLFLDLIFFDPTTKRTLMCSALPKELARSHDGRGMETHLRLTTAKEDHAKKALATMQGLIGKVLYADRNSKTFKVEANLNSLATGWVEMRVPHIDQDTYCCMRPLRIVAAKYVESTDAIILKLSLPGGGDILAYTPYVDNDRLPPIGRVDGTFYSSIPSSLTPIDLRGLRRNTVDNGMSRDAVEMIYGFPEKENDYGNGGTQLIYNGGRTMVYLNGADRVTGTQGFDF